MDADSTERATVQTYVPAYQKERWREHADRLDMSLSEFVRTMVQSGRRGFLDATDGDSTDGETASSEPPAGPAEDLESAVVAALSAGEHRPWDEVVDAVTGDVEDRIEETLQRLQAENRVQHSGRHGGYTLTDE